MSNTKKEEVMRYASALLPQFYPYFALPSISAEGTHITETAAYLQKIFSQYGAARTEIWTDCGGHPVVFAEFTGASDKTLLFYNHYDVQPPAPLDEWHSDPFVPTLRDGKLIGRGVCDDKGELASRLTVIQYFREHGGLPLTLKFLVEGEEEIGSPHVAQYVQAHAADLKADACIWEGGGKNEDEQFQVTCGMKGIVSFDLSVTTAKKDLHSSLACYADNAAWRLIQALCSLKGPDNTIRVDGFYDDVLPEDEAMKQALAQYPFNEQKVRDTNGLLRPFVAADPKKALMCGSTLTINGLSAGYEGKGTKTIIPRQAAAKLDCRLVPNQNPEKIVHLIQQQLAKNGYGDITVTYGVGEAAFRSDLTDPFIALCTQTANDVYGTGNVVVVPNMPGGGPGKQFVDVLHVPVVLVGIHYAGSGPHGPNENIRIADYEEGTYYLYDLLCRYAQA